MDNTIIYLCSLIAFVAVIAGVICGALMLEAAHKDNCDVLHKTILKGYAYSCTLKGGA